MGKFYGIKIRKRKMTIEEVPKLWRLVTEKWLNENPEA